MEKYKCCDNCNIENLKECKNCGILNWHYFSGLFFGNKNILICSFCKIETTTNKSIEFREAYHLCEKKTGEPKQIKLL